MSDPLVSAIITTCHRGAPMLMQAVESARNQTYRPLEIIVVSDNPPDGDHAREVAGALRALPDVRLIQLPRNSGAQAARNAGIRASSGDFVALLDDDDLWLPEKIARQMPAFSDPRVGLVYCRGYVFSDDPDDLRDYYTTIHGFRTAASFEELLVGDVIGSTSQAVIRRACFEDCGYFDERFRVRQDYDRWLAIAEKYRTAGIDVPLFLHRRHNGGRITALDSSLQELESFRMLYRKYRRYYHRYPILCMWHYYRRAKTLKRHGMRVRAAYNAARAFFWNPAAFLKKFNPGWRLRPNRGTSPGRRRRRTCCRRSSS